VPYSCFRITSGANHTAHPPHLSAHPSSSSSVYTQRKEEGSTRIIDLPLKCSASSEADTKVGDLRQQVEVGVRGGGGRGA